MRYSACSRSPRCNWTAQRYVAANCRPLSPRYLHHGEDKSPWGQLTHTNNPIRILLTGSLVCICHCLLWLPQTRSLCLQIQTKEGEEFQQWLLCRSGSVVLLLGFHCRKGVECCWVIGCTLKPPRFCWSQAFTSIDTTMSLNVLIFQWKIMIQKLRLEPAYKKGCIIQNLLPNLVSLFKLPV